MQDPCVVVKTTIITKIILDDIIARQEYWQQTNKQRD